MEHKQTMEFGGYTFTFLQEIKVERTEDGSIFEYAPQKNYAKKNSVPLHKNGSGSFCDFALEVGKVSGVYLWVCDGEVLYIGETKNMKKRFTTEYGHISPRKCYRGGQSTNCKMNHVALDYAKQEKGIAIYFLPTEHHKRIEKELLSAHKTPYNVKDN